MARCARTHWAKMRWAAAFVAISVLPTMSCLLLTDRNKNQCTTSIDCANKGMAFANTQCVQGVCVPVSPGPDAASDTANAECATTAECLANPSKPNTYCSADKQCLPIANQDCTTIATTDNKPITPDAIVLGVLAPLTGDSAKDGAARVRAVMLAFQEFSGRQIGIPTGPGTKPRPIALVVCDQVADPVRAATHLATHVGVPAVIGPGFSGATVKVAMDVTVPNGVLLMTPSATTPDLSVLQDNGLVWRTSSSFGPEAKAYADELAQMEFNPDLRAELGLAPTASLKVAILAKGDSYGKGLADMLATTLRYNGTDVPGNGKAYFARYDLPDFGANPSADIGQIISGIVGGFTPHILLVIGTAEVVTRGVAAVEAQWPTGSGAAPRPYYVISEGAKLTELITVVGQSTSTHPDQKLTSRIRVFGPRYNETQYSLLQSRFSAAFGEVMPDVYGVTGSYDAFYLIAYALLATQSASAPTGAAIAAGLVRTVPPGALIAAGPGDTAKAASELAAGRNIDYDGVTGPLDFNTSTGESPGDYNVYCAQADGFHATNQYYLAGSLQMVGKFGPCP